MNLTRATLKSDNSVYAQLALDLGPDEVKKTARMMGITHARSTAIRAESLGGLDARRLAAGDGERLRDDRQRRLPHAPDRDHEDRVPRRPHGKGKKLPPRFRVKRIKAFSDGVTYEATKILEKNVQAGTGTRAQIGCPAAGKTGTTDNYTDAWFVGFTPRLATAVWVGYPTAKIEMRTLFQGGPVAGGTFPAEIWGEYMKHVEGLLLRRRSPSPRSRSSPAVLRPLLAHRRQGDGRRDRPAVPERRRQRRRHAGRRPSGQRQRRHEPRRQRDRRRADSTPTSTSRRPRSRRRPSPPPAAAQLRASGAPPGTGKTCASARRRAGGNAGREVPAAPPRASLKRP